MSPKIHSTDAEAGVSRFAGMVAGVDPDHSRNYMFVYATIVTGFVAYFLCALLYGLGVGHGEVDFASTNSTLLPRYVLSTWKATYNPAGLAVPLGTDLPYIVQNAHSDGDVEVFPVSRTLALLCVLAITYGGAAGWLLWRGSLDSGVRTDGPKVITHTSKALFTVATLLTWCFVHTDVMAILAEKSKIASWFATAIIVSQIALYYVVENDASMEVLAEAKNGGLNFGIKHFPLLVALCVGAYMLSISVGVGIVMPLHYAGGISAIKEEYKSVVVFYILAQVLEFTRFALIIAGRSGQNEGWRQAAKNLAGHVLSILSHSVLFGLVAIYAFNPVGVIYRAGLL